MKHLKGGKYILDLGRISNGDDVTSKFPKEFIAFLEEEIEKGITADFIKKIKIFEISFYDTDYDKPFKYIFVPSLDDDLIGFRLNANRVYVDSDTTISVEGFEFLCNLDSTPVSINYDTHMAEITSANE